MWIQIFFCRPEDAAPHPGPPETEGEGTDRGGSEESVPHQNQVGPKAAFVGKPTPTKAKEKAVRTRFSPLNTMSVSSSTAFDVPAPSAG